MYSVSNYLFLYFYKCLILLVYLYPMIRYFNIRKLTYFNIFL